MRASLRSPVPARRRGLHRCGQARRTPGAAPRCPWTAARCSKGTAGSTAILFTVTVDGDRTGGVSVQYRTDDVTATARTSGNCTCALRLPRAGLSGLSFSSAESEKTVTITTCGDPRDEIDETFELELHSPSSGLTITGSPGIGHDPRRRRSAGPRRRQPHRDRGQQRQRQRDDPHRAVRGEREGRHLQLRDPQPVVGRGGHGGHVAVQQRGGLPAPRPGAGPSPRGAPPRPRPSPCPSAATPWTRPTSASPSASAPSSTPSRPPATASSPSPTTTPRRRP